MNRFHLFALAGLGVVALSVSLLLPKPGPAQDKGSAGTPAKWEYKRVYEYVYNEKSKERERTEEKKLNELGAEGWELCGVVSHTTGGPTRGRQTSTDVYFLFKRPKR